MSRRWGGLYLAVVMSALAGHGAVAQDDEGRHGDGGDRVGVFNTITVEGSAGDVACAFCTVVIQGDVKGDVAVLFGTVRAEDGSKVQGDVAALFSTLSFGEGTRIDGDLATALSTVQLSPTAVVRGDREIFASRAGLMVVAGTVLVGVGLVWLLVWGLRRLLPVR